MAFKFLPKVSKCVCCVPLPEAALMIAFTEFLFSIANVILFFKGMICKEDICQTLWLRYIFLAPYAWLCLGAVILIITYFDRDNKDLLSFAVIIKLSLIVAYLIILIVIFISDQRRNDLESGIVFLSLGSGYLVLLVYFTIVVNSWLATL